MDTAVILPFGDGQYRFWLPLPQVFELERVCGDVSLLAIEERLRGGIGQDEAGEYVHVGGGAPMVREIREVIRLGLIGGNSGMVDGAEVEVGPLRAKELIDLYSYPARPLVESALVAWRILHAAIFGVRLDEGSKKKAGEAPSESPSEKAS